MHLPTFIAVVNATTNSIFLLARAIRPFADINDLALRACALEKLTAANTLASLGGHRQEALWHAVAAAPEKGLLRTTSVAEDAARVKIVVALLMQPMAVYPHRPHAS